MGGPPGASAWGAQTAGSSVSLLEDVWVGGAAFGSWVARHHLPDPALPQTGPKEVGWGSGLEPGQLPGQVAVGPMQYPSPLWVLGHTP